MRRMISGLMKGISQGGISIGMLLIFLMVVHVSSEILSRVLFNAPLVATFEIVSYYYMVAIAFVPLGYVQANHEHIEAEAIANIVPRRMRRVTNMIGFILSMIVTAGLLYSTTVSALRQTRHGEAVMTAFGQLPTWPSRWLLPLGFAAMLSMMLYQLLIRRRITAPDDEPSDEIDQA